MGKGCGGRVFRVFRVFRPFHPGPPSEPPTRGWGEDGMGIGPHRTHPPEPTYRPHAHHRHCCSHPMRRRPGPRPATDAALLPPWRQQGAARTARSNEQRASNGPCAAGDGVGTGPHRTQGHGPLTWSTAGHTMRSCSPGRQGAGSGAPAAATQALVSVQGAPLPPGSPLLPPHFNPIRQSTSVHTFLVRVSVGAK